MFKMNQIVSIVEAGLCSHKQQYFGKITPKILSIFQKIQTMYLLKNSRSVKNTNFSNT